VAANVVARHEAGLNDNADGDERRHGPPVGHPSREPRATCRFVWYFHGSHTYTDDRATIVGDVALAAAQAVEPRQSPERAEGGLRYIDVWESEAH
jgi:hypothetical protein